MNNEIQSAVERLRASAKAAPLSNLNPDILLVLDELERVQAELRNKTTWQCCECKSVWGDKDDRLCPTCVRDVKAKLADTEATAIDSAAKLAMEHHLKACPDTGAIMGLYNLYTELHALAQQKRAQAAQWKTEREGEVKRYIVKGVAFVPVEAQIVVDASDANEAKKKAKQLFDSTPAIRRNCMIPNSHDDSAIFDFGSMALEATELTPPQTPTALP